MARKRGNGEGSITKRKDGLWMASVTVSYDSLTGKVKRSYYYGKTRKEVQEKLTEAIHELKMGTYVEPNSVTVGSWLDTWLTDYKKQNLRVTTYESYETIIRVHIKPAIGGIKLKDLRPEHLQRLYNDKFNNGRADGSGGLSARTVRYLHVIIRQSLEQAVKNNLLVRNVATLTTIPSEKRKSDINPFTVEQVKELISSANGDRLYPAILLTIGTGLRRGEVLGLRWQVLTPLHPVKNLPGLSVPGLPDTMACRKSIERKRPRELVPRVSKKFMIIVSHFDTVWDEDHHCF